MDFGWWGGKAVRQWLCIRTRAIGLEKGRSRDPGRGSLRMAKLVKVLDHMEKGYKLTRVGTTEKSWQLLTPGKTKSCVGKGEQSAAFP